MAPTAPLRNAALFLERCYGHPEHELLVSQGGAFFTYNGTSWPEVESATLKSEIYTQFGAATYLNAKGEEKDFDPTRHKVDDLLDALAAACHLPANRTTPAWLAGAAQAPATEIVACANGLLHVPRRLLMPHTPRFYVHHAVPFDYDAKAPPPSRWLAFLNELWPDDPESVAALQELFGYMLSGDTSLQKMFLLVGPKRSGKGTIARVLTAMMGAHHVVGPTLAGMSTNFGLSPLIGKPVAIVSDARIPAADTVVTERLLAISGEDALTIDRKYQAPWTGRLPTRLVILTNELPRLTDSSGALASRFIVLTMTKSFFGHENARLTEDLVQELPSILNWSLDGMERLVQRGRFDQPRSSADAIRQLEDLGSPIGAFVRERCAVAAGHSVPVEELYRAWRQFCLDHGRDHPGTAQTFGRDLHAVVPGLRIVHARAGGARARRYEGIGLLATAHGNAYQRVPDEQLEMAARSGTRSGALSSDTRTRECDGGCGRSTSESSGMCEGCQVREEAFHGLGALSGSRRT